jgi:hypothetical protein
MNPTVSSALLLRLVEATPEQLAGIERILGVRGGGGQVTEDGGKTGQFGGPRFLFRKAGSFWDVVFDGGEMLHLRDAVGARYLDYLLHRQMGEITAYDLEVTIQPERAKARVPNSIQAKLDGEAARACLRELTRLRAERERARDEGDEGRVMRLDAEIEGLAVELQGQDQTTDTGERSRNNVRKAITRFLAKEVKADARVNGFAAHILRFVSMGHLVSYVPPEGVVWE